MPILLLVLRILLVLLLALLLLLQLTLLLLQLALLLLTHYSDALLLCPQLVREAQRVTKDREEGGEANPWLRNIESPTQRQFYAGIRETFDNYFDLYGEKEEEEAGE